MSSSALSTPDAYKTQLHTMGKAARAAYTVLTEASNAQKDMALAKAAMSLRTRQQEILAANARDSEGARAKEITSAAQDRLRLTPARIEAIAAGLETIATLPDPVNKVIDEWTRPNGLVLQRVSIPLGVVGIIYESRPNVTADAAGLCIKAGNACILRSGSDALHSSEVIAECMREGLGAAGLPENAVQLLTTRERAAMEEMVKLVDLIDVIVPRGGRALNAFIKQQSLIPTLLHLDGNCHTYIHASADPAMAKTVLVNAKLRRTGICGATESLLIDRAVAQAFLPELAEALTAQGCLLRGDAAATAIDTRIAAAVEADWSAEYLDAVLSVKVVSGVDEAIAHINTYGSHHTDAIIAHDMAAARQFLRQVDSAIVMHNTSTQFADGGEFGFGAEIGISTGRLHARGPVGAEQLTTYKYVVHGEGQIRA